MNDIHLKIQDLWHQYPAKSNNDWSVRSFDLRLKKGELVGLLGPSGCGKTTLLRLIAGFEKPCKGSIEINGSAVSDPRHLLEPEKRGVGMVFQDYALFPHLDAWENACFGLKKGQDLSRANWLLQLLGLDHLRKRYPHQLSGGQKQRLALARALAPGSSLVLLDEPFSNLDVEVRLRLRSELSSVLSSCGASGVLVTHDPQEALAICDRVGVMCNGQLHQCAKPTELVHQPATSFVGRFVLQRNVLPVKSSGDTFITPIGKFLKPNDIDDILSTELMLDEYALELDLHSAGNGTIYAKEFFSTHWLLSVQIGPHKLRVRHSLESAIEIGDKCAIRFKTGHVALLFPGSIPCKLAI